MAAGFAQLRYIQAHPEVYAALEKMPKSWRKGCAARRNMGPVWRSTRLGPWWRRSSRPAVTTFLDAKGSDVGRYARYFKGYAGTRRLPGAAQFEAMFVSTAHTREDLECTLEAVDEVFAEG